MVLTTKWPYNALEGGRVMAKHHLLDALFRMDLFSRSVNPGDGKETFVLRHDDLNFQDIFCDPNTVEVTAIIDWKHCATAPRCIGYASSPIFLTLDWFPDYTVS
jgi:hypothetical protein